MRARTIPGLGRAAWALLAAALVAPACDSPYDPGRRDPAAIAVVAGAGQQGAGGQELATPIAVKVTDAGGRPVAGQAVTFHVTAGGGSVFSGSATTNAEGIAQERWTLGSQAGSAQALEARVVNGSGATLTATVTATVTAGAPATLTRVTPEGLLGGAVNSLVADTLAVRVTDALGNPVPGATVSWAATEGGGSTTAATSTADANGIAKMTWRLGPATNVVQGAVASIAGGAPVSFLARAADSITMLTASGATVSPGQLIDVRVTLSGGTAGPVPGVVVQWQASSGTVNPAVSKTGTSGTALGIASTQWTPGPTPGTQTLTATAGGLTATLTVNVLPSATRTLIAQVPGQVLDVTNSAVLWLDASGAAPSFHRRLPDGTDQTAPVSPGTGQPNAVRGYLWGANALLRTQTGQFYLWRADGSLLSLGLGEGLPSADGQWAAWRVSSGEIVRADLSTGSLVHIATTGATSIDVGANGDVVWVDYVNTPRLYHDGVVTQVSTQGFGAVEEIATDGVNIVYKKIDSLSYRYLWLDDGTNDILLASHSSKAGGVVYYVQNGGWVAYSTPATGVYRRSPAGAVQQITQETSGVVPTMITSDGTLVYSNIATGRYYLVTPAGTLLDAGNLGYIADGAYLFGYEGGNVYRITT